ncbi:hypothetical protein BLNAU_21547 [Blattamonas nauphoetae]|uniref:Uncharacterized protein n=1 Tax=Blattamonas nauphoetae TaxID=2049346 RepID=A0ABQ9WVL4_9EUKA|nr:hypothetical protein BLNAU_21547 [Blattamonas nauphoetae]
MQHKMNYEFTNSLGTEYKMILTRTCVVTWKEFATHPSLFSSDVLSLFSSSLSSSRSEFTSGLSSTENRSRDSSLDTSIISFFFLASFQTDDDSTQFTSSVSFLFDDSSCYLTSLPSSLPTNTSSPITTSTTHSSSVPSRKSSGRRRHTSTTSDPSSGQIKSKMTTAAITDHPPHSSAIDGKADDDEDGGDNLTVNIVTTANKQRRPAPRDIRSSRTFVSARATRAAFAACRSPVATFLSQLSSTPSQQLPKAQTLPSTSPSSSTQSSPTSS